MIHIFVRDLINDTSDCGECRLFRTFVLALPFAGKQKLKTEKRVNRTFVLSYKEKYISHITLHPVVVSWRKRLHNRYNEGKMQ